MPSAGSRAVGETHGAVSILNAIPTGIGGAVGVDLKVTCEVELGGEDIEVESLALGEEVEVGRGVIEAVREVLEKRHGLTKGFRARIVSEVPPARGLKSSSAFLGALVRAVLRAAGKSCSLEEEALTVVEIAKRARLTITGAFDDALASLGEGVYITDNSKLQVLRHYGTPSFPVVIFVPSSELKVSDVDVKAYEELRDLYGAAAELALSGRWLEAMGFNGLLTAVASLQDPWPVIEALKLPGTLAAGVTGKGPALFAVTTRPELVAELWKKLEGGNVVVTKLASGGAT